MPRGLSETFKTHLAGNRFELSALVEIEAADSTTVRYTDAAHDIDYGGATYSAQGNFLSFSDVEENTELVVTKCSIIISALDVANISLFGNSGIINRPVTIRNAFIDQDSTVGAIIVFQGKISSYSIADARATATITLEIANTFANFEKTNGRMTNNGSHQSYFPDDYTMENAHEDLEDILWGRK